MLVINKCSDFEIPLGLCPQYLLQASWSINIVVTVLNIVAGMKDHVQCVHSDMCALWFLIARVQDYWNFSKHKTQFYSC